MGEVEACRHECEAGGWVGRPSSHRAQEPPKTGPRCPFAPSSPASSVHPRQAAANGVKRDSPAPRPPKASDHDDRPCSPRRRRADGRGPAPGRPRGPAVPGPTRRSARWSCAAARSSAAARTRDRARPTPRRLALREAGEHGPRAEPSTHPGAVQPPGTHAALRAGRRVERCARGVVLGVRDPNPTVPGGGLEALARRRPRRHARRVRRRGARTDLALRRHRRLRAALRRAQDRGVARRPFRAAARPAPSGAGPST